jgi:hypothetical protein
MGGEWEARGVRGQGQSSLPGGDLPKACDDSYCSIPGLSLETTVEERRGSAGMITDFLLPPALVENMDGGEEGEDTRASDKGAGLAGNRIPDTEWPRPGLAGGAPAAAADTSADAEVAAAQLQVELHMEREELRKVAFLYKLAEQDNLADAIALVRVCARNHGV